MNTYTVRLYLFGYVGSLYIHPVMKLYWTTHTQPNCLNASRISAKRYAEQLERDGECLGYHIVVGLN